MNRAELTIILAAVASSAAACGSAREGDENGPDAGAEAGGAGPSESNDGGRPATIDDGSSSDGPPPPNRGRVVDFDTRRPLSGRSVIVGPDLSQDGARLTATDADGSFAFDASEPYQVLIIDPDGATVSYYERLDAAEPVLLHHPSPDDRPPPEHVATVQGSLSGGAEYPLSGPNDMVIVHLLSPGMRARSIVSGAEPPGGPEYSLFAAFSGEALPATLLALGIFRDPTDANRYVAAATSDEITLEESDGQTHNLELAPVPLGGVAGTLLIPDHLQLVQVEQYYRLPFPDATINFPLAPVTRQDPASNAGAFDYELPDLTALGGKLCLAGLVSDGAEQGVRLRSEYCGVALERDSLELDFEEVAALETPAQGGTFAAGTRFSWSRRGSSSAPNLLELAAVRASRITPSLSIYSTDDSATLPDLSAFGVELRPTDVYRARVVALGSGVDDAFGPEGLGSVIPTQARVAYSAEFPLAVGAP